MAEWRSGGKAGFAGVDVPAVLRGQAAELHVLRPHTGRGCEDLAGDLGQPERLGHLARAGVLAARGAADQQDAQRPRGVVVPGLRCLDCRAGGDPILSQVVVGIGEPRPGLACARALPLVVVSVPGGGSDPGELITQRIEDGIGELAEEAGEKRPLAEPWTRGTLAWLKCSSLHRSLACRAL
jgi:hypothetical protein